jgi:hypothetical protein
VVVRGGSENEGHVADRAEVGRLSTNVGVHDTPIGTGGCGRLGDGWLRRPRPDRHR